MHIDKVKHFKNRLLEEKKKLLKSKDNISKEEYGSIDMYYTEVSGYDNHPADIATEVFMKEQDIGFRNNMNDKLTEIDISLKKIDDGTFGICENCQKEIDEDRLELIPYSKKCFECADEEKPPLEFRQFESIEEEYATSFSNDPDSNVIYDREDSYQDVATFNIVPGDPSMTTGDNMGVMDEVEGDVVDDIENISQEYYDETLKWENFSG